MTRTFFSGLAVRQAHGDPEPRRRVATRDSQLAARGSGLETHHLPTCQPVPVADWRSGLPVLSAPGASLRELRMGDAPALCELLGSGEAARFISSPPNSTSGFERFVAWSLNEQRAGRGVCFAVVRDGSHDAIGIFQVRQLDPGFGVAEWGFALGRPYWGTGIFAAAAHLTIDFAFDTLGVHRLEARAVVANGRGNGALAKLGAVREMVLRKSFEREGKRDDQVLWSIVRDEWRHARAVWRAIH